MPTFTIPITPQKLNVGTLNAQVVFDVRTLSTFSLQAVDSGSVVGSWTITVYASNDGTTPGTSLGTITATGGMSGIHDVSGYGYVIAKVTSNATSGSESLYPCAKADA